MTWRFTCWTAARVPIGIPMPAAYVEIIKYALGDQIAALTTLRGKPYEVDEAARL